MEHADFRLAREIPWQDASLANPNSPARPDAGVTEEMVTGVEFRRLSNALGSFGPGQFWVSETRMPPGKVTPLHHEELDKFMYILEGSATFEDGRGGGQEVQASDCVVMSKEQVYRFRVGPHGVRFLLVRSGDAPPILDE